MKKNSSILPKLALVGVIGVIGGGYAIMNKDKFLSPDTETKVTQPQIVQEQWKKEGNAYSITWEHPTSGGRTGKVGFSLKLNKDKITGVDVTILTTNEESKSYQTNFKNEIAKVVVGKKISELNNIDVVGGASSTTKSFKDAVAALSTQFDI